MWQRHQTSNWNIKEHFPQHGEGTNITSNKYVYKTAFTEVLRVVHSIVRMLKLDCQSENEITIGSRQKCGFYGVCMDSSDITGILAQMIDDPSTCPLPYYRAPNTDDWW